MESYVEPTIHWWSHILGVLSLKQAARFMYETKLPFVLYPTTEEGIAFRRILKEHLPRVFHIYIEIHGEKKQMVMFQKVWADLADSLSPVIGRDGVEAIYQWGTDVILLSRKWKKYAWQIDSALSELSSQLGLAWGRSKRLPTSNLTYKEKLLINLVNLYKLRQMSLLTATETLDDTLEEYPKELNWLTSIYPIKSVYEWPINFGELSIIMMQNYATLLLTYQFSFCLQDLFSKQELKEMVEKHLEKEEVDQLLLAFEID